MKPKLDISDKVHGQNIRCNKQTLEPNGSGEAPVVFIGDVHIGSPQCDVERFKDMLDYCLKHNYYIFLMGDLIENSTRASVGAGVYEQTTHAEGQFDQLCTLLRPLAEKGLILGSLEGNHEYRTYIMAGVNLSKAICRELKVRYLGAACWNYWRVGKQSYRIYTLHGASGARYSYTKLKSLVDISHSFDCDLIAQGHVHECVDTAQLVQTYDPTLQKVIERKKWVLITGHYTSYDGGYAQAKGLPVSKLGSPKVKFSATHRDIHISW